MSYKTTVLIAPTDRISKRIKAVVYYGNGLHSQQSAEKLCKIRKLKSIVLKVPFPITVVLETKNRYFRDCDFIEIYAQS